MLDAHVHYGCVMPRRVVRRLLGELPRSRLLNFCLPTRSTCLVVRARATSQKWLGFFAQGQRLRAHGQRCVAQRA
jgi:hypothetical protein